MSFVNSKLLGSRKTGHWANWVQTERGQEPQAPAFRVVPRTHHFSMPVTSFTYRLSAQTYTSMLCSVMLRRESTAMLPRPLHPQASCWVLPLGEHRERLEWVGEQGDFLCLADSVSMCPKRSARAGSRFSSCTWTCCVLPLRGARSTHMPHTPWSSESRPFVSLVSFFPKP